MPRIQPIDIIEILLIASILYFFMAWIQRTRAYNLLRGILIVIIFILALFITSNRLMELNKRQREAAELEEERNRLNEELSDGQNDPQPPK